MTPDEEIEAGGGRVSMTGDAFLHYLSTIHSKARCSAWLSVGGTCALIEGHEGLHEVDGVSWGHTDPTEAP